MVNAVHLCLYTVGFTCSSVGTTSRSFPSNLSWAEVWERIDTGTWGTPVVTSLPARWLSTKSRGLNPSNPHPPVTTGRQAVLQTLIKSFKPFLTLQILPKKHPGPHELPKALLSPRPPPAPGTGPATPSSEAGDGARPLGKAGRGPLRAGSRPAAGRHRLRLPLPLPSLSLPSPPSCLALLLSVFPQLGSRRRCGHGERGRVQRDHRAALQGAPPALRLHPAAPEGLEAAGQSAATVSLSSGCYF